MKFIVALFLAIAAANAKPSGLASPLLAPVLPAVAAAPVSTQYHAQDEVGQYAYGYSNPLSSKAETRSLDGVTRGAYNYIDAEGKLQSVEYSSDAVNGFRVAASNLPVAPAVPEVPVAIIPEHVQDTPEVLEARARHLDALKEAEARAAAAPAPEAAAVVAKTVVPAARLAEPIALAPAFRNVFLPGVIPATNLAALRLGAPLISYNYDIPGAAVTYSTYTAPAFATYTSQIATPFWNPLAVQHQEKESVQVEAKAAAVEAKDAKEKSE